jgi:hypothetical protein
MWRVLLKHIELMPKDEDFGFQPVSWLKEVTQLATRQLRSSIAIIVLIRLPRSPGPDRVFGSDRGAVANRRRHCVNRHRYRWGDLHRFQLVRSLIGLLGRPTASHEKVLRPCTA